MRKSHVTGWLLLCLSCATRHQVAPERLIVNSRLTGLGGPCNVKQAIPPPPPGIYQFMIPWRQARLIT